MGTRAELQTKLVDILGTDNVYFQPPPTIQMVYPAIVYGLSDLKPEYAQNTPYKIIKQYKVTVIDKDPDSQIPEKISKLPMCRFDRYYPADNLNHFSCNLSF